MGTDSSNNNDTAAVYLIIDLHFFLQFFVPSNMYSLQLRIQIGITDNPLYTDTRYNDKIRYNDNLTVTQTSLKR